MFHLAQKYKKVTGKIKHTNAQPTELPERRYHPRLYHPKYKMLISLKEEKLVHEEW